MNVQCSNCRKEFKIVDPQKLDGSRKTITFKCSSCGKKEVLSKSENESWPQYLSHRSRPSAVPVSRLSSRDFRTAGPVSGTAVDESAQANSKADRPIQMDIPSEEPPKRRFVFSGLTGKVVILMLFVSLLPLGIYATVISRATVQRIEDDTDRVGQQITIGLAGHVNEWMDKNLRILQTAAQLPDIQTMQPAIQEPILKAVNANYPWKYVVFTVDAAGQNIARSDGLRLIDYSDRHYYKAVVLEMKPFAWQSLLGRTNKKPALILSVPIKRDGKVIGALCSGMAVEEISDNIVKWRLGQTGHAFLLDQTGKVVAHQVDEFVQTEKNLSNHPLIANFKKGQVGSQRFTENGVDKVGFVRETQWLWKVVIQQDESEIFAILHQANQFAWTLLAIAVVLVIVVATLASRAIVRPIKQLTKAAEKISTGDLEVQIDISSKNEIGELATAIRRMQDSIRFAIDRLRRARGTRPAPLPDAVSQAPF
ncbi:MAG: HAMP domain-containing protein [Deltaproteobacteria bacterium]|nr:HAMP domain-containing protein [Deltaproteobacteria bacterium]